MSLYLYLKLVLHIIQLSNMHKPHYSVKQSFFCNFSRYDVYCCTAIFLLHFLQMRSLLPYNIISCVFSLDMLFITVQQSLIVTFSRYDVNCFTTLFLLHFLQICYLLLYSNLSSALFLHTYCIAILNGYFSRYVLHYCTLHCTPMIHNTLCIVTVVQMKKWKKYFSQDLNTGGAIMVLSHTANQLSNKLLKFQNFRIIYRIYIKILANY